MRSVEGISSIHAPLRLFLTAVVDGRKAVDSRLPSVTCRSSATLEQVVAMLAATKLHRIFVVDADERPVNVVSLRDVIASVVSVPDSHYFDRYLETLLHPKLLPPAASPMVASTSPATAATEPTKFK